MSTQDDERERTIVSRRAFLMASAAAGAGVFVPWRLLSTPATSHGSHVVTAEQVMALAQQGLIAQTPLPGKAIPQFIDPLPIPHIIPDGEAQIELQMKEFASQVLPTGLPQTWVWGYRQPGQPEDAPYIGPVIVAERNTPTQIKFVNELTAEHIAWRSWVDQALHWANPGGEHDHERMSGPYNGPIPAVPHLHGGEVPAAIDGGPDAWYTSDGEYHGHAYHAGTGGGGNASVYHYPNTQEAAPIWFHDHALGATRLNVYAGLAGGYLITDPANDPPNLPPLVPLVLQDRMFDVNGQLLFPTMALNPEHPLWLPEFIGNVIVVNGKA